MRNWNITTVYAPTIIGFTSEDYELFYTQLRGAGEWKISDDYIALGRTRDFGDHQVEEAQAWADSIIDGSSEKGIAECESKMSLKGGSVFPTSLPVLPSGGREIFGKMYDGEIEDVIIGGAVPSERKIQNPVISKLEINLSEGMSEKSAVEIFARSMIRNIAKRTLQKTIANTFHFLEIPEKVEHGEIWRERNPHSFLNVPNDAELTALTSSWNLEVDGGHYYINYEAIERKDTARAKDWAEGIIAVHEEFEQ